MRDLSRPDGSAWAINNTSHFGFLTGGSVECSVAVLKVACTTSLSSLLPSRFQASLCSALFIRADSNSSRGSLGRIRSR